MKRAPRSRQRHDLYAKYHDYDSEISDLLGECGIKSWLPALGREEVAIYFDDQKKISDFSLFEGKLIIEMKFIDSAVSKAAVAKSLEGLGKFYSRNANVGILLMIIFVKSGTIDVDESRWEADFTHIHKVPSVITMVVKVP